jgi:hypothetical protein
MARAIGANSKLAGKVETTYGTAATGNYNQLPFYSFDLGSSQPLITPTVIGVGANRDPAAPIKDVISVEGNAVVPVDLVNIGHWLKLLFGAPTTTGATDFTHTFKSGAATLPSYSYEISMPDVPEYPLIVGVRGGSMALDFSPSGEARATIGLIGQGETRPTTSSAGTLVTQTYTPFGQFQGSIKRGGTSLAGVVAASLTYNNNLEAVRTIRSDGKIEGADPSITNVSGEIRVRYADTTLMTDALNGASISLELGYTISATKSLLLTVPECYLPKPKTGVAGPGGVEASFQFQGAYNAAQQAALVAVLRNQSAAATY